MRRLFFKRITFSLALTGSIVLAASSYAEQRSTAKPSTHRKIQAKRKSAVATPSPVPVPAIPVAVNYPPPPLTALQQPPHRARVQLDDSGLLIQADNSSLVQILREVANASGMKIDGLNQDERVFGSFGPGNAQEVLIRLLEGTSYNLLMVGDTEKGTPRQMVLTARGGATRGAYTPPAPSAPKPDEDEDVAPQAEEPQPAPEPIAAPPAQANPNQQQPSVKTPQQLLEELRKMRNQEEQNNRPQE